MCKIQNNTFLSKKMFRRPRGNGVIVVVVSVMLAACSTGSTFFQRSNDVASLFEKGQVMEDHRYYAGGPASKPNAIVAIDRNYTLDSPHWTEIAVTPETLRRIVLQIGHVDGAEYKERQLMSNGARMIAPDGTQVGIWYSVYDYSQVRIMEGNRVYLSFPPAYLPSNVRIPGFERSLRTP